jgi:uncharacterized protein (DUF58 family)
VTWLVELGNLLVAHPAVLLLCGALPLALVGGLIRVFPSPRLLLVFAAPCLLSLLLLFWPSAFGVLVALDLAVLIVTVADLLTIPKARDFSAERECQRVASLRKNHRVSLTVTNRSNRKWNVVIRDGAPQQFVCEPSEFAFALRPRSRTVMHYEMKPKSRGAFTLDFVHIRVPSRWGMWHRFLKYDVQSIVHVYPDMKQLAEYSVLARTNRLSLLGVRKTRRIGQDNEFERLRDYTLDDNYKHIAWRSTARRNKLTVKDFQVSHSQRLMFMLDCGRMMTNEAAGISLLDHSLNAILMLSYIALERGDSVGLITFSDRIHSYVPASGGRSHMNRLLHASFDRFPELVESRYHEAFMYLNTRCRKRSLVILVTNVIDEVNARQIEDHLSRISGRHLALGVFLRDYQLFDAAEGGDASGWTIFERAAAANILSWRRQVLTDLQHRKILLLDVFPEQMTAPLINQYLAIKARNLL